MRSTYSIVFTDRVWRRKVSFSHPPLRGSRKICLFIAPLSHSPLSPSRNLLVNRSLRWLLIDSRIYTHQREIIYVPIHATQSRYTDSEWWWEKNTRKRGAGRRRKSRYGGLNFIPPHLSIVVSVMCANSFSPQSSANTRLLLYPRPAATASSVIRELCVGAKLMLSGRRIGQDIYFPIFLSSATYGAILIGLLR